jgi:hypothetical protein
MNTELAINWEGTVVILTTSVSQFTLTKGEQFEKEMSNKQEVIVDDKVITTAENRRQWMHDKLDAWIDGVEGE